jgi:phosphoribosyl 1,2-cyclic phosphate phosphodiesterase
MLGDLRVTPLPLNHSKCTFGYLLERDGQRIAYLTDTKGLPPQVTDLLADHPLHCMVIDCSFVPGSDQQSHNNLDDVLVLRTYIVPRLTVLTHIGHDLDIWLRTHTNILPENVVVGSDGQRVFPIDRS